MSDILERIKKENIKSGTPIEFILKNAKYNDGKSVSGSKEYIGIRGYFMSYDKNSQQNFKILGYLKLVLKDAVHLEDNLGELIVDENIIHSYHPL